MAKTLQTVLVNTSIPPYLCIVKRKVTRSNYQPQKATKKQPDNNKISAKFSPVITKNTMMKRLSTLAIAMLLCSLSFAQNGISLEETSKNEGLFNITQVRFIYHKDFLFQTQGNSFTIDSTKSFAYGLQTITGVFLSDSFTLGLGVGLDVYQNPRENTLPLFFDGRWYRPWNEQNSMYLMGGLGWLLDIGEPFRKGYLVRFGVGNEFVLAKNLVMVIEFGYERKHISYTEERFKTADTKATYKGLNFSVGFIF